MTELGIEQTLKGASSATPFYEKYIVLKRHLFNTEYEHWAASFSHGNNHGPGHISRVLANLDALLGHKFLEQEIITPYELFLAMMSILYHDVGILRERKGHADMSGKFLDEETGDFIFDPRDRKIIRAAVVSHSSSKDIEEECAAFSDVEHIGPHTARPRVVAALVRLADELDEDYRRADPKVAEKIGIGEDSQFFWAFCQRTLSVRPDRKSLEIYIGLQFEPGDVGRTVRLDGVPRSFIAAFAEKLAKINRERALMCKFLPEPLRYQRLLVSIKPLARQSNWKRPREFVFSDGTVSSDFVRALPELLADPAKDVLKKLRDEIRRGDLDGADASLRRLEEVCSDLPTEVRIRMLWNGAIVSSLRAEKCAPRSKMRAQALDGGMQYLKRWHKFGSVSAWRELGETPENEVYELASDREMKTLFSARKAQIKKFLGAHQTFLVHTADGGGGGCVPAGVSIETPRGAIPIENVQVGMTILSASLDDTGNRIPTNVLRVHRSRERTCIRLNDEFLFTASQPLYQRRGAWILAKDLFPGCEIQTAGGHVYTMSSVEKVRVDCDVYTLTTDHPTHNFLVAGLICRNKKMI